MNQMIAELEELEGWAKNAIAAAEERRKKQEIRFSEKKQRLKEDCRRQAENELKAWQDKLLKSVNKEETQEKETLVEETNRRISWFQEEKETLAAQIVHEITGWTDAGERL